MATSDTNARIRITARDETKSAFAAASRSMAQLEATAGSALTSFAALAPAIAAAFSIEAFRGAVNLLDSLNDISDATGASIDALGKLEGAARKNGASMEDVGSILVKFNAALKDAKPDTPLAEALKGIGLNAAELRKEDPADALQKVAKALAGYADDGNKARLVQELFGKSVKAAAPFLKDLAENANLAQAGLTEQAKAAELFNKNMAALIYNVELYGRSIVGTALPALNEWIKREAAARVAFGTFSLDRFKAVLGDSEKDLEKARFGLNDIQLKLKELNDTNDPRGTRRKAWKEEADQLQRQATYLEKILNLSPGEIPNIPKGNGLFDSLPKVPDLASLGPPKKLPELVPVNIPSQLQDALSRIEGTDTSKLQRLNEEIKELQTLLLIDNGQTPGLSEALDDANAELLKMDPLLANIIQYQKDWDKALQDTPTGKLQQARQEVDRLTEALKTVASPDEAKKVKEMIDAVARGIGAIPEVLEKTDDKMSAFAEQASRNIQDALGDTLEQALGGNFSNIGKMWLGLLNKMLAQALAAKLNEALFGKSGFDLAGAIGTFFGGAGGAGGARAMGGPVQGGQTYLVGERGPELFTPTGSGSITPNNQLGGNSTTINVAAGPTRAEVLSAIQLAVRASEARTDTKLRRAGVA